MIIVIIECLSGSCVSVVTYAKMPSPVGVEEKLKGQGFHHAAVALGYQTRLRRLPAHSRDSLLVYSTTSGAGLLRQFEVPVQRTSNVFQQTNGRIRDYDAGVFSASILGSVAENTGFSSTDAGPHPADVAVITSATYKKLLPKILASRCKSAKYVKHFTASERTSRILKAQSPTDVTSFEVDGKKSVELLPGGILVLDHAIGALSAQPAWNKTTSVLKAFSKLRVPSPDALPDIRELVIGDATAADYRETAEWLDQKHQETKSKYGFCLPALDMECVGLILGSVGKTWDDIDMELILRDSFESLVSGPEANGTRFQFPVLLMYEGIGWQLHLRIPVTYRRTKDSIFVEVRQTHTRYEDLVNLLRKFLPTVGTGVREDVASVLKAVNILNRINTKY